MSSGCEFDHFWSFTSKLELRVPAAGEAGPGGALGGGQDAVGPRAPWLPPWWSTRAGRRATAAGTAPRSGGRSPPVSGRRRDRPGAGGGTGGQGEGGRPPALKMGNQ